MWDIYNSCHIFYSVNIDITIELDLVHQSETMHSSDCGRHTQAGRSASGTEYSLTSTLSESKTKSNEPLTKNYYSNWKCKTACFVFLFWHNSEDIKKVFLLSRHLCHLTSWWPSQLPYRIILPISTQVWIRRSLLDDIVIVFQARNSPKTKIHLMGFGSSPELWLNCYCWGNWGMVEGRFSKWF